MESMRIVGRSPLRRGTEVLSAAVFGLLAAVPEPGLMIVLLLGLVAIAIGAWSRGLRVGLWGLTVLVAASAARAMLVDGHWIYLSEELPPALLRAGVPWLAAVALRQYVNLGRQADQERELKRRERVAELERRSTAERLDLAQSLHDDLGHSLSLVALTVARLELNSSLPDSSRAALSNARLEIAQAVERLGNSVVSLRTGEPLDPTGTETAETVIRRARDAGARIDVTGLPGDFRLDIFGRDLVQRVLREAITNATRYAPGETITVLVTDTGDRLRVSVSNRVLHGHGFMRTSGTGLAGLRHTLSAAGGDLEATQQKDRFVVTATFPVAEGPSSIGDEGGEEIGDDEPRSGSTRRARRRLVLATVAVIVAGLAVGEAASHLQKSRTVLSPDDFASLSVGDTREDVLPLLPDHELPPRRGETRQPGCHSYAVTADSFNDAAGDIHRVCFHGDSVAELEYIPGEER